MPAEPNPDVQRLYEAFGKVADGFQPVDIVSAAFNIACDALASQVVEGGLHPRAAEDKLMSMAAVLPHGLASMIEELRSRGRSAINSERNLS